VGNGGLDFEAGAIVKELQKSKVKLKK